VVEDGEVLPRRIPLYAPHRVQLGRLPHAVQHTAQVLGRLLQRRGPLAGMIADCARQDGSTVRHLADHDGLGNRGTELRGIGATVLGSA